MYWDKYFNGMCFIIVAPLDDSAAKLMPFQDRVSYSVKSTASAPIPSQPVQPSTPKLVTLSRKRGQTEKCPTSQGRARIKPEENQPKVSQFFKPLVVLVDSSGDDFLPDLVDKKKKSRVRSKDLSFSPDYTPNYSYKFVHGPFALSSPARVKPTLTSPEMSPVKGVSSSNTNGYILLDSESD